MKSEAQLKMLDKMRNEKGFIAALDQSGGSTPKALKLYGVEESEYNGDDEMFAKIHEMRTRIVTSKAFRGDRIIGAILFENTLDRDIAGKNSAAYLWQEKNIVSFLKVDKGPGRAGHPAAVQHLLELGYVIHRCHRCLHRQFCARLANANRRL